MCLPYYSRGVVRLVGYILYRTLRWRDQDGNPCEENIPVPYSDLVAEAGISRRAIRPAIDDAVAGGFLHCITPAMGNASGQAAQVGRYALKWDRVGEYAKDPRAFSGLYQRDGNRSPIPAAFFERVLFRETLAVAKVVGTVLRHTVGYESKFGRRDQAPLSYTYIQKYANLKHRATLAQAIRGALDTGYIHRVSPGHFDRNAGKQSCPTRYAVKWHDEAMNVHDGAKTEPGTERGNNAHWVETLR